MQLLLTQEQKDWLLEKGYTLSAKSKKTNPCLSFYGPGPKGVTCKKCKHLYRKRYSKTYIKCDLRDDTNGPGTDHKAGWPACAKYEVKAPKILSVDQP